MAVSGVVTATDSASCEIVFGDMANSFETVARIDGSARLYVNTGSTGSTGSDEFIRFPLSGKHIVAAVSGTPIFHTFHTERGPARLILSTLFTRPTLSEVEQKLYDKMGVKSLLKKLSGIRPESDPINELRGLVQTAMAGNVEQIQKLIPSWLMEYYESNRAELSVGGELRDHNLKNWKEFFELRDSMTQGNIAVHAENTLLNGAQLYLLYAAQETKAPYQELSQRLAAVHILRAACIAEARKMLAEKIPK